MRDAGHYYYPLFKWCTDEWGAGRAPLWNPSENCGTSIVADPTASVFYPGKLVFALPVDFAVRFKLYVIGHVLLCAAAAYWLARRWGASVFASALAALSYAGGGSVVFQHANIVYLVGAAWLPVALGLIDTVLRERRVSAAMWLAVVLALLVLGGDPQMAYHVLLIGGVYTVVRASGSRKPPDGAEKPASLIAGAGLFAAAAVVAFLLASVQIFPSVEAAAASERAQPIASLFGPPQPGSHQAAVFDFSNGPWRLAELVWPNCGGRMFPAHRRWFSLFSEESRIWTPSLYMGLVPLVLAASTFSLRAADVRTRWLSWLVLIFVLGSFGTFGLGWLARQVYQLGGGEAASFPVGDSVGGVYWLFTVLLPRYILFRYPAKLFVVAALGISLLAAIGWDRALAAPSARLRRVLLVLGIGSGVATAAAWLASRSIVLGTLAVDPAFGPFDNSGAWWDIISSLHHALLVALLSAWLMQMASGEREPPEKLPWRRLAEPALLLLCAADLAIANHWLVPTAPMALWREPSPIAHLNQGRIYRAPRWWPAEFAARGSATRMEEIILWERQTLAGRYALLDGVSQVNTAPRPIASAHHESLLDAVKPGEGSDLNEAALHRLGVELLILPQDSKPAFAEQRPANFPSGAALCWMKPSPDREPIQNTFNPRAFQRGAVISAASWLTLAAIGAAIWWRGRAKPLKSNSSAPA
jgi:hypothetical protein